MKAVDGLERSFAGRMDAGMNVALRRVLVARDAYLATWLDEGA